MVDQLGLEGAVERFGERNFVTVALRADRRHDLGFAEAFLVADAEVFCPRIGTRMVCRFTGARGGSVQHENILTRASPRHNG